MLALLVVCGGIAFLWETLQEQEENGKGHLLVKWMGESAMHLYLPAVSLREEQAVLTGTDNRWMRFLCYPYPLFLAALQEEETEYVSAESDYAQLLLLEGTDEDRREIAQNALEYEDDALHLEMQKENGLYLENQAALAETGEEAGESAGQTQTDGVENPAKETAENPETEEAAEAGEQPEADGQGFEKAQDKKYSYQWDTLSSYEVLVKAFYAVDASTVADSEYIRLDALLQRDMTLHGDAQNPQILIYHTHSREDFVDSIPGDESTTIVGIGEYLAQILREEYGYNVLHHTACYDAERDYAYSKSLPAMEELLAQNPSVEVVIDLHRDEMPEDKKLVIDLNGRATAQFMFFNGMSQTKKGKIDYLENPYLADNLAFSFQMQVASNEYYPGLARRIYLKAYRYNMHICPRTLLIELGAQNNTVEEIRNACEPLAHILDLVLSGQGAG